MAFTASASMSRLLSLSSTATTMSMATTFSPSKLSLTPSFSLSPLRLKLKPVSAPQPRFSSASASASTTITPTISVGSKLPDATLSFLDSTGELQTTTISDLTSGKKTILFAVPGAFTPTCSQKHVPGFIEKSAELKSKGIDLIACVSVNDAFVMNAWKESLGVKDDEVLLLSDGNGDFTREIGAELDLRDKPVGLGIRSRRYSMLVEDGVVKVLNMEEGGAFTSSGAEDLLKLI